MMIHRQTIWCRCPITSCARHKTCGWRSYSLSSSRSRLFCTSRHVESLVMYCFFCCCVSCDVVLFVVLSCVGFRGCYFCFTFSTFSVILCVLLFLALSFSFSLPVCYIKGPGLALTSAQVLVSVWSVLSRLLLRNCSVCVCHQVTPLRRLHVKAHRICV